jgi:hypothetical protein
VPPPPPLPPLLLLPPSSSSSLDEQEIVNAKASARLATKRKRLFVFIIHLFVEGKILLAPAKPLEIKGLAGLMFSSI